MKVELILSIVAVPVIGGIIATRVRFKQKERGAIAASLARWAPASHQTNTPVALLHKQEESAEQFLLELPGIESINSLLLESGLNQSLLSFLAVVVSVLTLPVLIAFAIGANIIIAACVSIILAIVPFVVLNCKATARRTKFCSQLPDAIDLIVAVLRSGHSVAQAVKAVGQEIPNPCGEEFEAILHRMNLGQPLAESLSISSRRFRSYELDMITRAVGIQAEIGGSLAELLDKTNASLRQRLKLVQQLSMITAQSRLSAQIVGLLPIVLAVGLNYMNPGYLQILFTDKVGQLLLGASVLLEIIGVFTMRRMSVMKV